MGLDRVYECNDCSKRYKKYHYKCPSCGSHYLKWSDPLMKEAYPRLYKELIESSRDYVDDKEHYDERICETEELSWICPKCGKIWTATIAERLNGLKCPCMRKNTIIHFNGDMEEKPCGSIICKVNMLGGVQVMTGNQLFRAVEHEEIPVSKVKKTNHGRHTHYYIGESQTRRNKRKASSGVSIWDDNL